MLLFLVEYVRITFAGVELTDEDVETYKTELETALANVLGISPNDVEFYTKTTSNGDTVIRFRVVNVNGENDAKLNASTFTQEYLEELAKIPGLNQLLGLSNFDLFLTPSLPASDQLIFFSRSVSYLKRRSHV